MTTELVLAELLCCDCECVFCNSLVFYVSAFYFILWAVVSAGYPALLSRCYFERINDDDDDDVKSEDGIELLIGVCYNSNNGRIFSNDSHLLLRKLLCEVSQYHVLIMGDFIYPDIDWETLAATDKPSIDVKLFVECLMDNFYTQQVTQLL